MFILTIDSNDLSKIKTVLDNIDISDDNAIGHENGIDYEFATLNEQKWLYMSEFLHFNDDGETLKGAKK